MRQHLVRSFIVSVAAGIALSIAAPHDANAKCDTAGGRGCDILIVASNHGSAGGGTTTTRPVIIGPAPAPVPGGGAG